MTSSEIRNKFLDYFKGKGHAIYKSSSLVPDDPTLLLTAAGMVQFKPYFLGLKKPVVKRAASIQKCVRTTDIGLVGKTTRHMTFFEMLGNFSFGDYYKKEAIEWAWDFITNEMNLDKNKLWVTVYLNDDEAAEAWQKINVSPDRIIRLGEEHNFWAAGPTGPCGPCSELIFDLGEGVSCGKPDCNIGTCDCDRYLELWNLVFMQYDRDKSGKLHPLKNKGIDTGMGLERLAVVLQGVNSCFETDLFIPIVSKVKELSKVKSEEILGSIRLISDHVRAITFLIADGVFPSNEGRGYVLRRLIRRAVRYGKIIQAKPNFLNNVALPIIDLMQPQYPELKEHKDYILATIDEEESKFNKTLKQGMSVMTRVIEEAKSKSLSRISGADAFQLYDTFGFPLELTQELAEEEELGVDLDNFNILMEEQKKRSKKGVPFASELDLKLSKMEEHIRETEFLGYSNFHNKTEIVGLALDGVMADCVKEGQNATIILDKSVFYATAGGQRGDTGIIKSDKGKFEVSTTEKTSSGIILHGGKVLSGIFSINDEVVVQIDEQARKATMRNHTATHILHRVLRMKFGSHIKQAGSLVDKNRLRFDFTHNKPLDQQQIKEIEDKANSVVIENLPVRAYVTSMDYAKESGVTALFGEKYGDFVRVVEVGDISKELCGGTHVSATGDIGSIKITSESSVGANMRRIEAVTGYEALVYVHNIQDILDRASTKLNTDPGKLLVKLNDLIGELSDYEHQIKEFKKEKIKMQSLKLAESAEQIGTIRLVMDDIRNESMDDLRKYVDIVRQKVKNSAIILSSKSDNKISLIVGATEEAISSGFNANELVKRVSPLIDGGGGGKAEMAQAGGIKPDGISAVFKATKEYVRSLENKH